MKLIVTFIFSLCSFYVGAQSKAPQKKFTDKYEKIVDSLTKKGQIPKLIAYLQKEIMANAKNESALRWLGYLFIQDNKLDEGEKYYRKALAVEPGCGRCYMNIARAYAMKNVLKKAQLLFDSSITVSPADALLYASRGKFLEMKGDKIEALFDFNKAIAIDPNSADYFILRGMYNEAQGAFYLALSDMNKAIELAPDHYKPYFERASVYYSKKMVKEAMADLDIAMKLDSAHAELYLGRGAIFSANGEYEKAIADYNKAILLEPNDGFAYNQRATEKYRLEDMDGYCIDLLVCDSLFKKFDPANVQRPEVEQAIYYDCDPAKPGYYSQRGVASFNKEQYEQAVKIYNDGLKKFPANAMLLCFRGNAHNALKDYGSALKDYSNAFAKKEDLPAEVKQTRNYVQSSDEEISYFVKAFVVDLQMNIARTKFSLGNYDEALAEIDDAIKIAPQVKEIRKADYLNVRGSILLGLGRYREAMTDFDASIREDASFPVSYINRAITKVYLKNNTKIKTVSLGAYYNSPGFNANWSLPLASTVNNADNNIASALDDCDKAITIDPKSGYAWYIRGQIKKMLVYGNYCDDLRQAKALGYPVDVELMKDCGK
jgi:tetratricopeptide (TPR) repeat protein